MMFQRSTAQRAPARTSASCRQRGIAILMAVVLVGLIGVVLLAMTVLLASDAQRTRAAERDAQLHALLRIGTTHAHQRLERHGAAAQDVAVGLPPALAEQGAELRYSITVDEGSVRVLITATLGEADAAQDLTFADSADGWRLERAALQ